MANLSEVLLKRESDGNLRTGADLVDDDLAAIHGLGTPGSGVPKHSITELSGLPGSGKTAVALALIHDTVRRGLKVLYVGCDYRNFPWARIRHNPGWKRERFDSRIHTALIGSIEQLLSLQIPPDTGLVVVEHYDILIKATWSAEVHRRAADACASKFQLMSISSCIIATAGCVKTELHDVVVPGPAVKIWKKPRNMARIVIYRDSEFNYTLSTGSCFRLDEFGLIKAESFAVKLPLLLPGLSSKRQISKGLSLSQSPKTPSSCGMPTPASKRYRPSSTDSIGERAYGSPDPPSSPSSRKGKQLLSPEHSHLHRKPLTSAHGSQPLVKPYHLSEQTESSVSKPVALIRNDDQAGTNHAHAALASPSASEKHALDLNFEKTETRPAKAAPSDSFLGLEIIPNSQVEPDDADYCLKLPIP